MGESVTIRVVDGVKYRLAAFKVAHRPRRDNNPGKVCHQGLSLKAARPMGSQAQQSAPPPQSGETFRRTVDHDDPIEAMRDLSLAETLRVMDVAREMRDNRVVAEEMFRREDLRAGLRQKLMRQAALGGDNVTEAEIDAAIDLYFERQHVFENSASGMSNFMAHVWIWRGRIVATLAAVGAAAGALYYFF